MKAIHHEGTTSSIIAKVDKSIGYRINTPELTNEQRAAIFDLQNKRVEIFVNPLEAEVDETLNIDKDVDHKTPSQRQRHIIYAIWKNQQSDETFSIFYEKMMDKIANALKTKYLDEYS
ncbi:MAG TPA: hypothetical protein VGL94_02710 [Ktedonobacteraceae bacterium]|jgi:hypothetical protein